MHTYTFTQAHPMIVTHSKYNVLLYCKCAVIPAVQWWDNSEISYGGRNYFMAGHYWLNAAVWSIHTRTHTSAVSSLASADFPPSFIGAFYAGLMQWCIWLHNPPSFPPWGQTHQELDSQRGRWGNKFAEAISSGNFWIRSTLFET